jgi:hypothetical protein
LGAEGWGHRSGGEALPLRGARAEALRKISRNDGFRFCERDCHPHGPRRLRLGELLLRIKLGPPLLGGFAMKFSGKIQAAVFIKVIPLRRSFRKTKRELRRHPHRLSARKFDALARTLKPDLPLHSGVSVEAQPSYCRACCPLPFPCRLAEAGMLDNEPLQ